MLAVLLTLLLSTQKFLLMEPIEKAFLQKEFSSLNQICNEQLLLEFDYPQSVSGNYALPRAIKILQRLFKDYSLKEFFWGAMHVEADIAVQSLNLIINRKSSSFSAELKLIFFMRRDQQWKLFLIKGLKK